MSKTVEVENAGVVREVDMFDKKKSVLETVGKIKPHKKKKDKHDDEHKGHKKSKHDDSDDIPGEDLVAKSTDKKHRKERKHSKDHGDETLKKEQLKDHDTKKAGGHGEATEKSKSKHADMLSDLDSEDGNTENNDHDHTPSDGFRFAEVIPPEDMPKAAKMKEENKKVLESVRDVEDRLKGREQVNLTMMSIELATLPSAHRFTKNSPWLKGAYGTNYSWVAEYEESEDGSKAAWRNLRWSFNLERNERDRNDLVITVCSKNLIIGRYVLGKEEFADIPDTKTGYFEVTGDVMSGIGPAGKIKVLFLKGKAERPHGPMKAVSASDSVTAGTQSALKIAATQQRKLYVKVISTAVMDLKSVHFLDVNCPFVAVEVGDWVGVSDTAHNAGMAARWNSLNWKFTVTTDVGIHLMIHSKNVMIGRMHVSMEEISNLEPKANNIIEVIKSITDGKDITGKVKINLLAESPQAGDVYNPEGSMLTTDFKTLDADGNVVDDPNAPLAAGFVGMSPGAGDLAPLKPFMRVPFQINVREVTVLDTVKAHYLRKNSLSVNVVCGAWGKATDELRGSGSFAHWINLQWKIPIKGGNHFRITAWSHGASIGSASITVAELLDMPTDYEQNTEIFAKLINAAGDIVGKVKLSCKYESLVSVVNDQIVAIVKEKGDKPTDKDFLPNVGADRTRSVNFLEEDSPDFEYEDTVQNNVSRRKQELTLPLVATIKTIAIYDAISVHTLKKNTPQLRFICDRKSATTEPIKNAGAVAHWPDLNWIMKIRADSHVVAVLMSGEVTIGKVELNPKDLLSIPVNDEGLSEIKTLLKKDNTSTAKLHLIVDLKSLEDVLPPETLTPAARLQQSRQDPYSYPIQMHTPGFGNTAGPLDALSVASWGQAMNQSLPQMTPQYLPHMHHQLQHQQIAQTFQQQQMMQQMMMMQQMQPAGGFGNFASSSGSVFGNPAALPGGAQRVPTIPRPNTMPNTAYNNTISMANSFNPNVLMSNSMDRSYIGPYYGGSPEGAQMAYGHDQRSVTWGSFAQTAPQATQNNTIFDRNLMSADNARKLGISFNIAIQEIDLIDLQPVHKLVKNSPFVSAACGKWTASSPPILNAGDTAFWTKLNWKSTCTSGGNLRLIVNSKNVILGAVNFGTDDLLNAVSDDKGLRRVTANIVNEQQVSNGRIKVAYTMDIVTKSNNPNSPEQLGGRMRSSSGSVAPGMSTRGSAFNGTGSASVRDANYFPGASPSGSRRGVGLFGATGPPGSASVVGSSRLPPVTGSRSVSPPLQPQYPYDMGDDSYYDELIDPDPRRHVEFPFNIHILEMSTLDLIHVHQLKRNQPVIKVFCDTFYNETKICAEYADVTYFRELNWIFPVKEKSIFKITVASREKEIGSTRVDLNQLKSIPFDQFGNREIVLSFADDKGRAAGKVRLITKLSNVAINEYDQSHYDNEPLGMDGVSVNAGAAGGTVTGSAMGGPLYPSYGSSVKRRGSNAVMSQVNGGMSVAGSVPGVSYGKDFEYLLQSQVEAANELSEVALLQLTLTGIAVIDLRSVHTFAPNSPSVNLACGKVVATTTAAENAGKMANWEDLNVSMPLDRTATLRVLISSRDKVIGQVTITRAKLLDGRKNQKGFYVLFGELDNNGKIAGKIKFVYSLEDASTT